MGLELASYFVFRLDVLEESPNQATNQLTNWPSGSFNPSTKVQTKTCFHLGFTLLLRLSFQFRCFVRVALHSPLPPTSLSVHRNHRGSATYLYDRWAFSGGPSCEEAERSVSRELRVAEREQSTQRSPSI